MSALTFLQNNKTIVHIVAESIIYGITVYIFHKKTKSLTNEINSLNEKIKNFENVLDEQNKKINDLTSFIQVKLLEIQKFQFQENSQKLQNTYRSTQQVPLQTQQVPLQTQQVPLQTQQVPLQTQQVPLQTQQVPLQTQQVPMKIIFPQNFIVEDLLDINNVLNLSNSRNQSCATPATIEEIDENLDDELKEELKELEKI